MQHGHFIGSLIIMAFFRDDVDQQDDVVQQDSFRRGASASGYIRIKDGWVHLILNGKSLFNSNFIHLLLRIQSNEFHELVRSFS